MSVRKRTWRDAKGRVQEKWMIHIKHQNPTDGTVKEIRKVSPVNTRRGAEAYERELREQLLSGSRGKEETARAASKEVPTLGGFVEDFMAFQASPAASHRGPNKPGELNEKRRVLKNHLVPAFGPKRLDQISAQDIDLYVAGKHGAGLSSSTISNHLIVLRRMLNVAKRWELIHKLPNFHAPKKPNRVDFLSVEETEALLGELAEHWRPVVLLALRTGLRLGELRGLRWTDVDLVNARIRVEQNLTTTGIGTPKSGKGRTVPLARDILEVLKTLRPTKASGFVFRSPTTGGPMSRSSLPRALERAGKRAELHTTRKVVTAHLLRHTFASQAVLAGVPIRVVQAWLGHADITMTMRYAHLSNDAQSDLIDRLVPTGRAERGAHEEHMVSDPSENGLQTVLH